MFSKKILINYKLLNDLFPKRKNTHVQVANILRVCECQKVKMHVCVTFTDREGNLQNVQNKKREEQMKSDYLHI